MSVKRQKVFEINISDIPGSMHCLLIQLAREAINLDGMIVTSLGGGKGKAYLSAMEPDMLAAYLKRAEIESKEMAGFLVSHADKIGAAANTLDPLSEAGINGVAGSAMACDNRFGMMLVVRADQGDDAERALS
ncbi:MAG: hypothetical protein JW804_05440 [Sedimentisphaerales bacterium]|nr:hypothetical protein [Sedimentisphaerales bacterium]